MCKHSVAVCNLWVVEFGPKMEAITHCQLRHLALCCSSSTSATSSFSPSTSRWRPHSKDAHSTSRRSSCLKSRVTRMALEQKSPSPAADAMQSQELIPYTHGPLDDVFLKIFRRKMAQEVGWDSSKPGYDGLVDVAKRLLVQYRTGEETERATVRVLRSLFPTWLLPLFKQIVAPLGDGKPAAILCAQVTLATCQWLMGRCTINEVELADGTTLASGVLVQKCKYLDETKCAGICIHTCKLPTQAFMNGDMGVLLTMEPNYEDFSCQFKFGVEPLPAVEDAALKTPCLAVCPTAASRASIRGVPNESQCPQVTASL